MQDSVYLGELGGLSRHRQMIVLDQRGTGRSATPKDSASYRCDRLVEDVEALREHLGLAGWTCSPTPQPLTSRRCT
jgi:pimeloyl-ACP methyl ester carboxylesterase